MYGCLQKDTNYGVLLGQINGTKQFKQEKKKPALDLKFYKYCELS